MSAVHPDDPAGNGPMDSQPRHAAMERIRHADGISYDELWMQYFGLTGDVAPLEVEAYLQGLMPLPSGQQDILAQALRECIQELRSNGADGQDAHGEAPT
jgi:hypothetical protein